MALIAATATTMIWGLMLQLGHNMWYEGPLWGEPKTPEEADRYAQPRNRTDEKLWYEITEYAAKKGVNMVVIDLGEGLVYPSHPELAVEGSWSPEKMKAELKRLRSLGLEPIPKLNFSAKHDAWLKDYSRMVSSETYYKVCADLIRDVCEIFGKPRLFHVGMDEERAGAQRKDRLVVERQGELWWHDFLFFVREVEKCGSKAWCWSDYNWVHHEKFLERMPHEVLQSNWHYFYLQHMVRNDKEIAALDWPDGWAGALGFREIDEAGFENIPCASNYKQPNNLETVVRYCRDNLNHGLIKGFLMAPWQRTYGDGCRAKLMEACDLIERAIAIWNGDERQVVIYGATPAGIAAAVEARRNGLEPLLIEPSGKIGGMTTGGLGQTDSGFKSSFGGLARQFYRDIKAYYDRDESWRFQRRSEYRPRGKTCWEEGLDSMWTFEPRAAEAVLDFWMRDWDIRVRYERLDRGPGGVVVENGRIKSIRMENGAVYRAQVFMDCTYEGDLMAAAGVSYVTGREDNAKYGETVNGIERRLMKNHQIAGGVSAYVKAGDPSSGLLPGVENDVPAPDGTGDDRIQAYCYRMCLTDVPENRIPFKKPEGYRELDFELLLRNLEKYTAKDLEPPATEWQYYMPWLHSPMPNRKTDTNNRTGFSTDFIGGSQCYPEASYAERAKIEQDHLTYQQGLMWTLANHPRVPAKIRDEVARWGTCRDEFRGERGDGWPRQLYVREARRLVGEYVMTEHECRGKRKAPHPVALGAYGMDSHNVRRHVDADGCVRNEGNVEDYSANPPGEPFKRFRPYGIDYGAIVPKRGECANLFVPVCVSASHIAFGSIRMEPAFFALGQAAGAAAALVVREGCTAQDVDYGKLRELLLAGGQVLEDGKLRP